MLSTVMRGMLVQAQSCNGWYEAVAVASTARGIKAWQLPALPLHARVDPKEVLGR